MKMELLPQYELLQNEWIEDVRSQAFLLRHKKSGARVVVLENEDENKVFNIGFRTLPTDSTGVPHILEHSVLCGSRKYPVKDPFVELVKGSLNTFLNAMTYPDKTMYPVASCNDQDFKNLMEVYLDAVFYPNIYQKEEIFCQEGWSYQLENPEDPITINGVVYNEMKGAFSSPEDVLDREILNSLFPDTVYGVESGGDPAHIPDLAYEDFLAFHKTYYDPSNSYIYLYGNMDAVERLTFLDTAYLSAFSCPDTLPPAIGLQQPFAKMRRVSRAYPVAEADELSDATYLSFNAVVGTSLDVELTNAFSVLEYALLSSPGAPLKQALLDAGIGNDIMGNYDSGIYQPYFSIVAKNANEEDADRFLSVIRESLAAIVSAGIDKKALLAGINQMEFKFREADYGSYPKGLFLGLDLYDSWLYADDLPFAYIKQLAVYEALKEKVNSSYYEELVTTYLLNNTHTSFVTLTPERGLTAKTDAALAKKLADYKASLSKEEIEGLIEKTKRLRAFQETPAAPEDLAKLPMLTRADIGTKAARLYNTEVDLDGVKTLHHEVYTNGIAYVDLLFDASTVTADDLRYFGLLKYILGMVDTKSYTYADLNNEINCHTGGVHAGTSTYVTKPEAGGVKTFLGIRIRTLYEKLPFALSMAKEILTSRFTDDKRLYEIIAQLESRLSMQLQSAGHQAAAGRAVSYFSRFNAVQEELGGISFYELVADLEENFEARKDALKAKLSSLVALVVRRENLFVSATFDAKGLALLRAPLADFASSLPTGAADAKAEPPVLAKKNEGFLTPAQVQYVARAGSFASRGFSYTGTLRILKVLMSYEYLWVNVRVKGGAYGCMCNFYRRGDAFFVSYRDPNLAATNEIFEGIPSYLNSFSADEHEMTKYIIGAISDLDAPLTPAAKGSLSLVAYFSGLTEEQMQAERDQVLSATAESIRALAPLVQAILDEQAICVIGGEEKIKEAKELFGCVRSLKGEN